MFLLMCYDYDQYNINLIISFVITIRQLVAKLIIQYTRLLRVHDLSGTNGHLVKVKGTNTEYIIILIIYEDTPFHKLNINTSKCEY